MTYRIRFNKTRGQPGRGSSDHAWRVFDQNNREIICKHILINVPSRGEKEPDSDDWNIVASGELQIDRQTSTVIIS